jgi:hypothetical protein
MEGYDSMPPFLMSIVGDSDIWLFISSCGALTAGRGGPDRALFPYYTDDRIHDSVDQTGSKTIVLASIGSANYLWEPFSPRYSGLYRTKRSISKSAYGNQVEFEEINEDLGLLFSYSWTTSPRYGLVREARLRNIGASGAELAILDGLLNIMPADLTRRFQSDFSTLADAYREAEFIRLRGRGAPRRVEGLALFKLSSVPSDMAEPRESLMATTVWSVGLEPTAVHLCADALESFRRGEERKGEERVRGRRGAYLMRAALSLPPDAERAWITVADVGADASRVRLLLAALENAEALSRDLRRDVSDGTRGLRRTVASVDGHQLTGDMLRSWRHWSNALFNAMRGGVPVEGYLVSREDFRLYLADSNRSVAARSATFMAGLPEKVGRDALVSLARATGDRDLERLAREYLPLTFSRRHGDPSRPWNSFSIATRDSEGRRIVGYEGNWRDIFQNWEALALSFPGYIDGMIFKFLDATTADGYNPYRITRRGIEWEVVDESDAWSSIGYWGDHQAAYLLRLLEASERYWPGALGDCLARPIFVYANVPYRVRPYAAMLDDPKSTVDFDPELHDRIIRRSSAIGEDGKLLCDASGVPYKACLAEKLLVTILCKLSNLIPDAGIWMNTQRPEWNDANNALVGNGVSVVTLCYMRGLVAVCRALIVHSRVEGFDVSSEVARLTHRVAAALSRLAPSGTDLRSPEERASLMDELGGAGSDYRSGLYENGLSGLRDRMSAKELEDLLDIAEAHIVHDIRANRRPDGMFNAYNLIRREGRRVGIRRLPLMLEGQVAALSSGILSPEEEADLLEALRSSELYRPDQDTYILYPDRILPSFLEKNNIPPEAVERSRLVRDLIERGGCGVFVRDGDGGMHFDASIRNARDLGAALDDLMGEDALALAAVRREEIFEIYESVFDHHSFTGRSGTFYKYEGLGCVYWHMVSKLLLAAGEALTRARSGGADPRTIARLKASYRRIREGLGTHKPPAVYGAFPTDPYSHTPSFAGAQQPGMTGQVKEDIISRLAELGVQVRRGCLAFAPSMVAEDEALPEGALFGYVDEGGEERVLSVRAGCYAFTICQIPVVVHSCEGPTDPARIELTRPDGSKVSSPGRELDQTESARIFSRSGDARRLDVFLGGD